jgi:pre-mRNA-splicing factor SYF1
MGLSPASSALAAHPAAACCCSLLGPGVSAIVQSALDLSYEESLLRDPYSLSHWWTYLDFKADAAAEAASTSVRAERWQLFERALRVLPGSYKLWNRYINERVVRI